MEYSSSANYRQLIGKVSFDTLAINLRLHFPLHDKKSQKIGTLVLL